MRKFAFSKYDIRMRRILSLFTASFLALMCAVPSYGQGYMATKVRIDSLKPYTFHGTASVGGKVEQTDNFTVSVDGGLECMVPFKKHKLRFAGSMSFNLINTRDNGNRGFGYVAGDFYQFNIDETRKIREKTLLFFSVIGGAQYDFCRDLQCRAFAGMLLTFQPLRKHPHLCLEPGFGVIMDFMYWNVLAGADRKPVLDYYNDPINTDAQTYLGIAPDGYCWQQAPSVAMTLNFMGEWNKVAFNLYVLSSFLVTYPFENDKLETQIDPVFQNMYNTKRLPLVTVDGSVEFKIWKRLSFKVNYEFLWDGGQMPNYRRTVNFKGQNIALGARNMRYCVTGGLAIRW